MQNVWKEENKVKYIYCNILKLVFLIKFLHVCIGFTKKYDIFWHVLQLLHDLIGQNFVTTSHPNLCSIEKQKSNIYNIY